jgi:hypothetical protein
MTDETDDKPKYVPSQMAQDEDDRYVRILEGHITRDAIYFDISSERERQDAKWGGAAHDKHHTVSDWVRFIHEHASKANEAASHGDIQRARARLIEVAALAVAGLEVLDKIEAYSAEKH